MLKLVQIKLVQLEFYVEHNPSKEDYYSIVYFAGIIDEVLAIEEKWKKHRME